MGSDCDWNSIVQEAIIREYETEFSVECRRLYGISRHILCYIIWKHFSEMGYHRRKEEIAHYMHLDMAHVEKWEKKYKTKSVFSALSEHSKGAKKRCNDGNRE